MPLTCGDMMWGDMTRNNVAETQRVNKLFIGSIFHNESRINLLCWCTSVYMVWHQNIWRERVFSCPLYLADHTSVPLRTTNFLYRDRSLLPWALGRSVHPVLPRGTLFQLGYGTHHWHSNSSSVCSKRHCLRDCHCTRLSDSSLLFVRFEVSVYYYYYVLAALIQECYHVSQLSLFANAWCT